MTFSVKYLAIALTLSACLSPAVVSAQTPTPAQNPPATTAAAPTNVEGEWHGALEIAGMGKLRLALKLKRQGGQLTGTLDSPDQGATDLPLSDVTFADRTLRFVFPNPDAPGTYEGVMSADGS